MTANRFDPDRPTRSDIALMDAEVREERERAAAESAQQLCWTCRPPAVDGDLCPVCWTTHKESR